MGKRADQIRDNDAIQRDCVSAFLDGDRVEVAIHSYFPNQTVWKFYEPKGSKNVGNPKIELRFPEPNSLRRFLQKSLGVLDRFQDEGATTSECLTAQEKYAYERRLRVHGKILSKVRKQ